MECQSAKADLQFCMSSILWKKNIYNHAEKIEKSGRGDRTDGRERKEREIQKEPATKSDRVRVKYRKRKIRREIYKNR